MPPGPVVTALAATHNSRRGNGRAPLVCAMALCVPQAPRTRLTLQSRNRVRLSALFVDGAHSHGRLSSSWLLLRIERAGEPWQGLMCGEANSGGSVPESRQRHPPKQSQLQSGCPGMWLVVPPAPGGIGFASDPIGAGSRQKGPHVCADDSNSTPDWSRALNEFSTIHDGWLITLEIVSDALGAQPEITGLPLIGVTFEAPNGGTVTISAGRLS